MARYCTMRTLGQAQSPRDEHAQNVFTPSFPHRSDPVEDLSMKRSNELPVHGTNYVKNHKSVMRLRGLTYTDLNGSTSTRHREVKGETTDRTPRRSLAMTDREDTFLGEKNRQQALKKLGTKYKKAHSEGNIDLDTDFRLPDISSSGGTHSSTGVLLPGEKADDRDVTHDLHDDWWNSAEKENQEKVGLERQLSHMMEAYKGTPGWNPKRKNFGRKLGNVCSSNRLSQLLESKRPLRMENFYNYYP